LFIHFQIVAQEYLTEERHMASAEVIVHIQDVNDNWPRFENDSYVARIPENSARGTFVTRVTVSNGFFLPSFLGMGIILFQRS